MFVREKTINGYTYLYLVENIREGGRTRQHIIRNLGRKEAVLAAGDLDRLMASIGRFSERAMVLNAIDANPAEVKPSVSAALCCSVGCGNGLGLMRC